MQNEELQHVFNLSEHQNHRYNGFYVSPNVDRASVKTKRGSPKKKNTADMAITATTKPAIKRRSKIKNSVAKAEDVINGFSVAGNVYLKNKDLLSGKYRTQGLNHLNNVKADKASFESINSILSSLNNNLDASVNHSRASLLNHARTDGEVSGLGINYSRNQYNNTNEFVNNIRGSITKAAKPKLNHVSGSATSSNRKLAKLDESKTKKDQLPSYLCPTTQFPYRLLSANSMLHDGFVNANRAESGGKDVGKKVHLLDKPIKQSCESKLFLRAKRRRQSRRKWQMDNGTRHEALQRIQDCLDLQDNLQRDLLPLNLDETGYDKSDNESSSEECSNTFQNHWFHSMSEIAFDDVKRNLRLSQLYNELKRQLYQIKQNKCELPVLSDKFMKPFIEVARTRPVDAAYCVNQQTQQRIDTIEPLILVKKKCVLEVCKNVALPCMPTCVRHVLLCDKQMLFEQCRVRDSNSFQCDRPVLNIKYHYPVCSVHSKPNFVLPDFSRPDIKYEDVRRKNVSTVSAATYKTDADLLNISLGPVSCPSASSKAENKKRMNLNSGNNNNNAFTHARHQFSARSQTNSVKREREKKTVERKELKVMLAKNEEPKKKVAIPVAMPTTVTPPKPKETLAATLKEQPTSSTTSQLPEVNQNLLRDWVSLSDGQLVDTKTLESTLPNDFVNGFDINASSIQSQLQDMINSETSLSTNILMGAQELPNYIQVEEMIEEVEITDETLDSSELGNQELVHSEDFNAVLKQLPPEAFNELFSEFTLSEG